MADAAASCPILLICDAHDGGGSQIECEEWRGIGYDCVRGVVKDDIACPELFRASLFLLTVARVFPHSQQVVKGDGSHVTACLELV